MTDKDKWVEDLENNPDNWESDEETLSSIEAYNERKNARVNIRVPQSLIEKLRKKAQKKGLAYQTYVYSELYKIAFSEEDLEDHIKELEKRIEALEDKKVS